jgi:BirA family transcriptional regulator, biotin operon repressor / biotin---[acetyl-CoA-carboxylase] ligase
VIVDAQLRRLSLERARDEVARALDGFAARRVGLKWPNDLQLPEGKLGGILVEARWHQDSLEWVAVGIGVNVLPPQDVEGAGLRSGTRRANVVEAIVPAVLSAMRSRGALTGAELAEFATRDIARGRDIVEPLGGVVRGIAASGALLVETEAGVREIRSGSLVFASVPQSLSANS